MAFVLELQFTSHQKHLQNFITATTRKYNINSYIKYEDNKIICTLDDKNQNLQDCLTSLEKQLPASLFLKGINSYTTDEDVVSLAEIDNNYPINIALCPSCQKEIFDVSSKRYYYPFTSCVACGGNYSFLTSYPYSRENSSLKFIVPCKNCQDEINSKGLKEKHHINSCHDCGIAVRMSSKSQERYANDAGSFRTMFEVSAKAINDNKTLLIKTTFGYRVFYKAQNYNHNSILMMINASKITDNLSLITEEFNALLSIERPILNVTLKNEDLKSFVGANTSFVKYPDDGFSILLGAELQKLGIEFVAYEDVDKNYKADITIDYDIEINQQTDMQFFLNKDIYFIAKGQRVSFPSTMPNAKKHLSISPELVGIEKNGEYLFDTMEHFDKVVVDSANILEDVEDNFLSSQKKISYDEASFLSVIIEHNKQNEKCVGAYFDDIPSFLYYNSKTVIRIVPPKEFITTNILEDISNLRDGSDRLIQNLQKTLPDVYKKLQNLQTKENVKLFEAVAIILGLDDESFRGVTKEAMKFVGKGGIQIDTHVKDNRFDYSAFLASIISYQLAGGSSVILAYSIFESFGDYFSEIIGELKDKTKATEVILCGSDFANQSLFSRIERNFKLSKPLMNKNYPIGKETSVVGGAYL